MLIHRYQTPLQENGILKPELVTRLFSNIGSIVQCNQMLLRNFETTGIEGVGNAFQQMVS